MTKLIVILGPTSSGKSALAVKLARLFNGEVVSADSRQVYKGLNIGSGKIPKKEMQGVPHHLLDVANPKKKFSVAQFQKLALKAIEKIQRKGKIPFLVGGTGFYIQSIVDGIVIPEVKPNWKLRKKLSSYKVERLYEILKKLDPGRAKNIDPKNPHRLIRAIEIIKSTGRPVQKLATHATFNALQIGISKPSEVLKKDIHIRLLKRVRAGMVKEVEKLHRQGLSWERLEELGLEYRCVAHYLQQKISRQEMIEKIQKESEQFAKRQMTWFKRDKRIHWISNKKPTSSAGREAQRLIGDFLAPVGR